MERSYCWASGGALIENSGVGGSVSAAIKNTTGLTNNAAYVFNSKKKH